MNAVNQIQVLKTNFRINLLIKCGANCHMTFSNLNFRIIQILIAILDFLLPISNIKK